MSVKFSDIFSNSEFNINNPKFEEMINKTRDMAETVGKKSAEHLQYSRKKLELLDAKAKLTRLYEKFGKLQYDSYIGAETDGNEIENTAMSISQLREKIDLISIELESMKEGFRSETDDINKKCDSVPDSENDISNVKDNLTDDK